MVYVCFISMKFYILFFLCAGVDMPTPRTVLTGHQSEITCVATIAELGLVVSGSKGEFTFVPKSITWVKGVFIYYIFRMKTLG